jgi:hypothetical protein
MTTNWRDLVVTDANDPSATTELGKLADTAPETLDSAVIVDGAISEWTDYFLSAPGEAPDWDTPRGDVDWTGFEIALRGRTDA